MGGWPALKEVRTFLRMQPDPNEDLVISAALAAAVNYGVERSNSQWPADSDLVPDSAHQACVIHAARLYRRRDSIDGTLGWGDMGLVRVGRVDPDIDALYALVCPLVFG